jgi:TRAP-type C4-dicarboxylate transport system permease large subunit
VFIVIAASGPFAWLLAKLGTIASLEQWLMGFAGNPVMFVLVLVGLILLIGTFLDAPANIIIFGPMFVAVSAAAGFPPVTAALVVVVGFLLGMVTPPVGVLLPRLLHRGAKLERVAVEMVPYMLIEVVVLFLMFAVPALTLGIPRALGLG